MSQQIQTVPFHGDTIDAIRLDDGTWAVSLRRMCENLGVSYGSQYNKLQEKPWAVVLINKTTGSDGKTYEMTMIDRRTLTMWLAGINPGKVHPELREKIEAYQCEAADALDKYFNEGMAVRTPEGPTSGNLVAQALTDPKAVAQILLAYDRTRTENQQLKAENTSVCRQLEAQQPYAAIGSRFVRLDGTITIREAARNFQSIDPTMTMSRVFTLLRDNEYITRQGSAPTVKATRPGYLKQKIPTRTDGKLGHPYAVFTAKGIGWFISRFISHNSIHTELDLPTLI